MKNFASLSLFTFAISASTTTLAFDGLVDQCNTCNTDLVFQQTAKLYYESGAGKITLYNLRTGVIHSYQLRMKAGYPRQMDPPPEAIDAVEVATDPTIHSAFVNVSGFYQASGNRLQAAINIPYTDLGTNVPGLDRNTTAYDVTEDYNLRNRIGIEIANNKDRWNQVRAFMNKVDQTMLLLLGLQDEAVLEVRVTFADGSTVLYRISTKSTNSTKLEYVSGSATTPKNQGIPDANQPQYQGIWYGTATGGDDLGRFGRHMSTIGATVEGYSASGWSSRQQVRCTWKVAHTGNTLVCLAVQ